MKLIKISAFLMLIIISCSRVKSEADKITREYIEKYKPDITVKSASIDNMTLSDITLNTLLEIKNNLPFEIPIEKLEINLINSSGDIFANSVSSEESNIIKIPANGSKEMNMKWAEDTGYMPTRNSVLTTEEGQAFLEKKPAFQCIFDNLNEIQPRIQNPAWDNLATIWKNGMAEMINENMDVTSSMQAMTQEINEVLEDQ